MADLPDFGTELSCITDIAADSRVVSGFTVVAEAILRRWSTPRGRLIGYPNYGFDLTQFVNADMSPRDIVALSSGASAEALKDERVDAATVEATLGSDGILTLTAVIDTSAGPFTFVASVSDITVKLLEMSA